MVAAGEGLRLKSPSVVHLQGKSFAAVAPPSLHFKRTWLLSHRFQWSQAARLHTNHPGHPLVHPIAVPPSHALRMDHLLCLRTIGSTTWLVESRELDGAVLPTSFCLFAAQGEQSFRVDRCPSSEGLGPDCHPILIMA